jgi:hypothetical protein
MQTQIWQLMAPPHFQQLKVQSLAVIKSPPHSPVHISIQVADGMDLMEFLDTGHWSLQVAAAVDQMKVAVVERAVWLTHPQFGLQPMRQSLLMLVKVEKVQQAQQVLTGMKQTLLQTARIQFSQLSLQSAPEVAQLQWTLQMTQHEMEEAVDQVAVAPVKQLRVAQVVREQQAKVLQVDQESVVLPVEVEVVLLKQETLTVIL